MATWEAELKKAIAFARGSRFYRRSAITSSTLTTTAQTLGNAATGRLRLLSINFQTDATGLAGATAFQIKRTGTYGAAVVTSDAVSGLGANVTHDTDSITTANNPGTTNNVPIVLEAGDTLTYLGTVSAGTGAGVIVVTCEFERIDDNADMTFVNA